MGSQNPWRYRSSLVTRRLAHILSSGLGLRNEMYGHYCGWGERLFYAPIPGSAILPTLSSTSAAVLTGTVSITRMCRTRYDTRQVAQASAWISRSSESLFGRPRSRSPLPMLLDAGQPMGRESSRRRIPTAGRAYYIHRHKGPP